MQMLNPGHMVRLSLRLSLRDFTVCIIHNQQERLGIKATNHCECGLTFPVYRYTFIKTGSLDYSFLEF